MLRCPDPSCVAAGGHDMVGKSASEEDKKKYNRYFLRSYIEDNRKVINAIKTNSRCWIDAFLASLCSGYSGSAQHC